MVERKAKKKTNQNPPPKNIKYCKQFPEQVNCKPRLDFFFSIRYYTACVDMAYLFLHSPQSALTWLKILILPNTGIYIRDI